MDSESFLSEIEVEPDTNIGYSQPMEFSTGHQAVSNSKTKNSKPENLAHFNSFLRLKQEVLSRVDKSIAGCVDEAIASFVSAINSETVYCTTSSCSGRIVIVQVFIFFIILQSF